MGIDGLSQEPPLQPLPTPWAVDATAVAAALVSDPVRGLAPDDARNRLRVVGPNELRATAVRPAWRLLLEQLTNAMILVLISAAVATALIGDLKDTVVILAIVAHNGIVGLVQEYRAEQAMDALKRMTSPSSRVVRGGFETVALAPEQPAVVLRAATLGFLVVEIESLLGRWRAPR